MLVGLLDPEKSYIPDIKSSPLSLKLLEIFQPMDALAAILDLWLLLELPKVADPATKLNLFKDPISVQINHKSL